MQTWGMFRDRAEAGLLLGEMVARRVETISGPHLVAGGLVLGLPRGGVPVAALVAEALGVRLDVLVVRKVGAPWQPELALGAVGEGGAVALNDEVVSAAGLTSEDLDALIDQASREVEEIVAQLRPGQGPPDVHDRMVIVCDDGVATGATARAAASVLRSMGSGPVILATPVAAPSVCERLMASFDEVICTLTPRRLGSVGQYYERFEQVSIKAVRELLEGSPS